jgi:hypothetical protein
MPIRPDLRDLYPPNWPQISHRAKVAAAWRCQACGVRHLSWGWRDCKGFHEVKKEALIAAGYRRAPFTLMTQDRGPVRVIEIVLAVAHLDHDPRNCDPDNLRVLCQADHLAHDAPWHRRTAAATVRRRMATLELAL